MKFAAEGGLWTTGGTVSSPPGAAVLEVSGAVLAWTVDDPAATAQLTVTDVAAADWLWRVTGERGHVAVVEALRGTSVDRGVNVDIAGLEFSAQALAPLRRLAVGHWLRRWWPASARDGIADLDASVLDAELAVLTAAAQDFFGEDTLDSDLNALLSPHRAALERHRHEGDPRVSALAESCVELADWPEVALPEQVSPDRRRDDYALAAAGLRAPGDAIGRGTASISWSAVPAGIFDAAEDTVDWSVHGARSGAVVVTVRTAVTGPAAGVPVQVRNGDIGIVGVLDERGAATLDLPISEPAAWNRDWRNTSVVIGHPGSGTEDRAVRNRLRAFARSRLDGVGNPADPALLPVDAFLAEILAAESDY